ncbi:branched-chain amino acid ABC transporter permease [Tianweitania sediminis]|uniref:Branched-chain amino acid ABC transporter permease n=1 Tax=Tianweitania sediminis TaxID=1502156 RepID=A0A8J7QXR1_9HYPH|nr:branched-chain amino acid ABC transporter permease [Tianweitania sediminis]MBP0438698.1 branched-chain amino acid ABC transporter permease [Tianweitania sediminis]HEV7414928.1 branched-chain amino acid ABC transporter permease [Tianweitania sediminis]
MVLFFNILSDAFVYGMVLFIISVGLSLAMGLMKVVNLAHGAFAMIGGYIASYITQDQGMSYTLAVAAAVVGAIIIAVPMERLLYRRIYGTSELTQVLMTIGITFVIIGVANFIFGPTLKTIPLPDELRQRVDLGFRTMSSNRVFIAFCGAAVAAGLWYVIEKTDFGIKLRAAVENEKIAGSLGIKTSVIFSVSFALATGLAAFGGVIGAELLPIEPYYALTYMVMLLVVVCVGGAGSIGGALAACLILGTVDTVARYLLPSYGAFFFYFAVIIIVLMFPNGLFGRKLNV